MLYSLQLGQSGDSSVPPSHHEVNVTGRVRQSVAAMPSYRPGKDAAQVEAEHGIIDAIKLASNETPWPPVDSVVAAIRDAAEGINRYADHRATALRSRLATWLGVDAEMVTVGPGSAGLLQQVCLTFVDSGDEVVFPWRSFEVYPVFTQLMGGRAVTVPLDGWSIDLDAVAGAVGPRAKVIFLATPNNPTGTALATTQLGDFLERVPSDVVVVIDEAYREFNDPSHGDPVTDLVVTHPNVVVLRTFSKAHGLAGLRVGYGVAQPRLIEDIDKTMAPFAVNSMAQAAGIAAIEADGEIRSRLSVLLAERAKMVGDLRAVGHEFPDPHGNFLWLPFGDRTDQIQLGLEHRGVVTRPFSGEGIRVTIGSADENDRFRATLAEVMEQF